MACTMPMFMTLRALFLLYKHTLLVVMYYSLTVNKQSLLLYTLHMTEFYGEVMGGSRPPDHWVLLIYFRLSCVMCML